MNFDFETAKNVASLISPLTGAVIDTYIKPKLKELVERSKVDREVFEHSLSSKFEEYLTRTYEQHSYITTIVFPNQQKRLEDLYIPLTVKTHDRAPFVVDSYRKDLVPSYKKIIIKDSAGMGKTTLLRFLYLSAIKQNVGIPIFIELRYLTKDRSVLDIIHSELNPIDEEYDRQFIHRLIRRGDFIFFLDGYDEIPFTERETVTRDLHTFISKAWQNSFIISSREETALASFYTFREFKIEPLKRDQAFTLIDKYDPEGVIANKLKKRLQGADSKSYEGFLVNPLLVSLLFKTYEYKSIIPLRKHIFYRQIYDALFETHDLTKGAFIRPKHCKLDIDLFHVVIRTLGMFTVKKGTTGYDKDELLKYLSDVKKFNPTIQFKETDLLKDLVSTVPLFICEGDYYRWSHKAIQEYFAAQFICTDTKSKQGQILRSMCKSPLLPRYIHVLDLCYDIDYKTFRNTVIRDLISEYLEYYDGHYRRVNESQVNRRDVDFRKSISFSCQAIIFPYTFFREHLKDEDFISNKEVYKFLKREGYHSDGMGTSYKFKRGDYRKIFESGNVTRAAGIALVFNQHYYLIDLLALKREPIVHCSGGRGKAVDAMEVWDGPEPVLVDDDPRSDLNDPLNFAKVNQVIAQLSILYLGTEACRSLKERIERELRQADELDFF
ncbi:MAG TPA: NACHT domain-containing protein [Pyrinomonadaceae bacterium]